MTIYTFYFSYVIPWKWDGLQEGFQFLFKQAQICCLEGNVQEMPKSMATYAGTSAEES
jgi:hypothetical protein